MRVVDPATVTEWFRPPADQPILWANGAKDSITINLSLKLIKFVSDLELYTTRTDGYGLITLAALLLVLADAVPLPHSLVGSAFNMPASEKGKKPYAKAVIILTIFHHITTGIGYV